MNHTEDYSALLESHGVKPTAVRLLIYRAIASMSNTFNMAEIEDCLDTVDKSTIFRTLMLFTDHHLLHSLDDGSGSKKYCLCHNDHECSPSERHCHFFCENCHKTYCLEDTLIPQAPLPEGFQLIGIDYLMRGICPSCANKG